MSKKKSSTRVISSSIHKDFAVFSKSMINDYHLTKEHVNTLKHVDGKLIKVSQSKIVNETGKTKYQSVKMPLLIKDTSNPRAIITTKNSDAVNLSNQKIILSNEALLYLVHLAGHPKNVFLYILYYLLNEETLEFRTDSLVQHYYMEFCKVTEYNSKTPSSAMKDAIKKLVEMRLIINVGHNLYMMNPIVLGFKNNVVKNNAFTLYVNKLAEKDKVVEEYLLPQINISRK
ncbi:hypothetical protein [Flavobacterium sp.]|jgi:hypothetical protein|uniref:hypothetical protein n=1 Tax=Flavobacterium sp. TaxID=239 RepID=UPI0037C05E59